MPELLAPREAYNLWAESWDADRSPLVALESAWMSQWLTDLDGAVAVDSGCGTGRWLAVLRERGAQAVGFDFSSAMLAQAARKPGLAGSLARMDLARPALAPGCADVVLCSLALGHVADAAAAIAALALMVRSGGRLLFSDFHPAAYARGWKRTFRNGGQTYEVESHAHDFGELAHAAASYGLALDELLEPGFDEAQRPLFRDAGKETLFESVRGLPALLLANWSRG
jgi:SAM-dependent methyltransferase